MYMIESMFTCKCKSHKLFHLFLRVLIPRFRAKSSTGTLITSVLTPISVAYLLIQYIPAVTVATPTGFGINSVRGEERSAAKGAPRMELA